jgi:hypothetical protein
MPEPRKVKEVEEAARLVLACLAAVGEHLRLCREIYQRDRRDGDAERPAPAEDTIEEIAKSSDRVSGAMGTAAAALAPFEWDLPSVTDSPVETKGLKASSWSELVLRLAARFTDGQPNWRNYDQLDPGQQKYLFRVALNGPLDLQDVEAGVKIEAARLRDRLRALSTDSRYGLILRDLTPQSRRLFYLLTQRTGQPVTHEEIAEDLWGDDAVATNRIYQAKHSLVEELTALGFEELGSRIASEGGAYRLVTEDSPLP